MPPASPSALAPGMAAHPNDLDRRRIERALNRRKRYRYVSPSVAAVSGGYHIASPCCSRNVDPDGGVIDVALLQHDMDTGTWQLFRKNHHAGSWDLHSTHDRLASLLDQLIVDEHRSFWQ